MRRPWLILILLFTCCLVMTGFVLRRDDLHRPNDSRSALAILLGDGRRLFANHFLAKADAYFHRGRYPSIFEMADREQGNYLRRSLAEEPTGVADTHDEGGEDQDHDHHEADEEAHEHTEACAHAEPPAGPNDWIARLAARFEPNRHVHLEEGGEKEMLPWIRLAVEMDPHNVDAYTIGGYWLRRLGKLKEAEAFLREGLRNNPGSSEIYFELGRLQEALGTNPHRAIRLYELSLEGWREVAEQGGEPDPLALPQILGRLGHAHADLQEYDAALYYYRELKKVSVNPEGVQHLIDAVEEQRASQSSSHGAL